MRTHLRRREFLGLSAGMAVSCALTRTTAVGADAQTTTPADAPLREGLTPDTSSWVARASIALKPAAMMPYFHESLDRAAALLPLLGAAVHPVALAKDPAEWAAQPMLGKSLAVYAKNIGADPKRYEPFEPAARRIVAGIPPTAQAPEVTSTELNTTALKLGFVIGFASEVPAENRGPQYVRVLREIETLALLGQFHARRILAAVHYNLFFRSQRLAELYAAVLDTRHCLATWKELVAITGNAGELTLPRGSETIKVRPAWQEELTRLGYDLADLEAQCCPPDEAMLKEKVWEPGK